MTDTFARVRSIVGATADWAAHDIVLGDGEIAIERIAGNVVKLKVGNGTNPFSTSPYVAAGTTLTTAQQTALNALTAGTQLPANVTLPANLTPLAQMAITKAYADAAYLKATDIPKATAGSQILVSDAATGFPWKVGDLDEGRY
jgi:hypothetical protein